MTGMSGFNAAIPAATSTHPLFRQSDVPSHLSMSGGCLFRFAELLSLAFIRWGSEFLIPSPIFENLFHVFRRNNTADAHVVAEVCCAQHR